jgi:hypothetical protein
LFVAAVVVAVADYWLLAVGVVVLAFGTKTLARHDGTSPTLDLHGKATQSHANEHTAFSPALHSDGNTCVWARTDQYRDVPIMTPRVSRAVGGAFGIASPGQTGLSPNAMGDPWPGQCVFGQVPRRPFDEHRGTHARNWQKPVLQL